MSTLFPGALDAFVNPTAASNMNDPAVAHHTQHANSNDAIEALQQYVGIAASTDVATLTNKVAVLQADRGLRLKNIAVTANYTLTAQDYFVRADAASGAVSVNLPAAAAALYSVFVVKKTDVSANAVNLTAVAGELIDTFAALPLANAGDSLCVISNGIGWNLI